MVSASSRHWVLCMAASTLNAQLHLIPQMHSRQLLVREHDDLLGCCIEEVSVMRNDQQRLVCCRQEPLTQPHHGLQI